MYLYSLEFACISDSELDRLNIIVLGMLFVDSHTNLH